MSDSNQTTDHQAEIKRSLKATVSAIKNRRADQEDVVVDMKAAESARLELLAAELQPVIDDIDETDERFDFALSKGSKPRLWIDMSSFVAMGHDKRSYRFLKDTRMGRLVLSETGELSKMADIVSEYIGEKVLDRERMLDEEWVYLKDLAADAKKKQEAGPADPYETDTAKKSSATEAGKTPSKGWRGFLWFLFGVACCIAALIAAAFLFAPDAF